MRLRGKWVRLSNHYSRFVTENHDWGYVFYCRDKPEGYKWRAHVNALPQDDTYLSTEAAAKRQVRGMLRELIEDMKELQA